MILFACLRSKYSEACQKRQFEHCFSQNIDRISTIRLYMAHFVAIVSSIIFSKDEFGYESASEISV